MQRAQPEEPAFPPPYTPREVYAAWKCTECGVVRGGFISPYDYKPRRCLAIPSSKRTDGSRICGGSMNEVFREGA